MIRRSKNSRGRGRERKGRGKIKTEMGLVRLKEGHLKRCCRYVAEALADKRRRRKEADKRRRIGRRGEGMKEATLQEPLGKGGEVRGGAKTFRVQQHLGVVQTQSTAQLFNNAKVKGHHPH